MNAGAASIASATKETVMFTSLQIAGYRGFESYTLNDLARVNLIVGKNNCGKTSVLEAVNLLTDNGSLRTLARFATQRRQWKYWPVDNGRNVEILDLSAVFFGYRMKLGTGFTVASNRNSVSMETVSINKSENGQPYSDPDIQYIARRMDETTPIGLKITADALKQTSISPFPITERGSLIYSDGLQQYAQWEAKCRSRFLGTTPMYPADTRNIWDRVGREGLEDNLMEALRTLEPSIASIIHLPGDWSLDNVLVDLGGGGPRIGIGSFGEGMRRVLDIALALIDLERGVLLMDEIDTGLHWTALDELWRFVINAARESNIQVFATTHSYDCLKGLALLMEKDPDLAPHVSLQKIKRGLPQAASLRGDQLPVAIKHAIEVR